MSGGTYVIAGGKGGVGRTTTALNVGAALEKQGYNVALVDADVEMTDLGEMLGLDPEEGVHGVLTGEISVNDAIYDGPHGLTVVPGDPSLAAFAAVDETKPRLHRVSEPLTAAHDIVLLDTAAGLRRVHQDAFEAADGTILVTTPTDVAVSATEKTAAVARRGTDILGVTVTHINESTDLGEIVTRLEMPALAAIPETGLFTGAPVIIDHDGVPSTEYDRLANAIAEHADTGSVDAETVRLSVAEAERDDSGDDEESLGQMFDDVDTEQEPDDGSGLSVGAVADRVGVAQGRVRDKLGERGLLGEDEQTVQADEEEIAEELETDTAGDEDALENLFDEQDDEEDESSGGRLSVSSVADRVGVAQDKVRDRLSEQELLGEDEETVQADEDEIAEELDTESDDDALDALFEDDDSTTDAGGSGDTDTGDSRDVDAGGRGETEASDESETEASDESETEASDESEEDPLEALFDEQGDDE